MRSQDHQNRIIELLSVFVTQVKGHNAVSRTDINRISETILIPIFKEVFGYRDLKNLNDSEGLNYPAIDLGDETAKVAIQVTATPDSDKIKHTLHGFVEHKLFNTFDRVQIYILTEKQKSYSGKGFQKIVQGRIQFDVKTDILDYRDLIKRISSFQIDELQRIRNILEANFGNPNISFTVENGTTPLIKETTTQETQKVYLNLLGLQFPSLIYIADLAVNREQVIKNSKDTNRPLKRSASTRDVAAAALKQFGMKFGVDWTCHEGKVVTFHDLRDQDLPITAIIDLGTVTPLNSQEFYEIDNNYENVFKSLLGRCLQQKLYHLDVVWQHQEKLFIFTEIDNNSERKEDWYDKGSTYHRTVYERVMKNNKPDEILSCKHFGFRTRYIRFGNKWYLSIVPNWFFSFDGYRKSLFAKKNLDWLKCKENDKSVSNHLRFIAAFLKTEKSSNLFHQYERYPFLSFGDLITFENAPALIDKDWLPVRTNSDEDSNNTEQMELLL
jgi:hypothetical protein